MGKVISLADYKQKRIDREIEKELDSICKGMSHKEEVQFLKYAADYIEAFEALEKMEKEK